MLANTAAEKTQQERQALARTRLLTTLRQDSSAEDMSLTDQLAYYEMEADAIKKVGRAIGISYGGSVDVSKWYRT